MSATLLANIQQGDVKTIARSISFIENEPQLAKRKSQNECKPWK